MENNIVLDRYEVEVVFYEDSKVKIADKETRFRFVDVETGEIVDDAQGYGYRTARGAYKAYFYRKHRKNRKKQQ